MCVRVHVYTRAHAHVSADASEARNGLWNSLEPGSQTLTLWTAVLPFQPLQQLLHKHGVTAASKVAWAATEVASGMSVDGGEAPSLGPLLCKEAAETRGSQESSTGKTPVMSEDGKRSLSRERRASWSCDRTALPVTGSRRRGSERFRR